MSLLVIHCADTPDISMSEAVIHERANLKCRCWHTTRLEWVGPDHATWQKAQEWLLLVGNIGADTIRSWHLEKGWSDIGYHDVIRRDGIREAGRPAEQMGAHVQDHNKGSLACCWVGREFPTQEQYDSLVQWAADKCVEYGLTASDVKGHRELAPLSGKTCPGIDMDLFRADVTKRLQDMKCGSEVGK